VAGNFIVLNVCWDWVAEGNIGREYRAGIYWRGGGDANPARDGGVGATRWNRRGSITGNSFYDLGAGGIWGGLGQDITMAGNVVERALDLGIHSEGGRNITITGNTATDCKNGEFACFFVDENAVITGNSARKTDTATYGTQMFYWNNGSAGELTTDAAASAIITGNSFVCEDNADYGTIRFTTGTTQSFSGNSLINVKIEALPASATGKSVQTEVRDNSLKFTNDLSAAFDAMSFGRFTNSGTSGLVAGALIEDNRFECGFAPHADSNAIYIFDDTGANSYVTVRNNRDISFPTFFRSETNKFGSAILFCEIAYNEIVGRIIDYTDGANGEATTSVRHFHMANRQAQPTGSTTGFFSTGSPDEGIYIRGSRGPRTPTTAGYMDWIVTAPAFGSGGGVKAVWSGTYASGGGTGGSKYDHVEGSDGKTYIAVQDGGEAQDPTTDSSATHWRLVADDVATFKGAGLIE